MKNKNSMPVKWIIGILILVFGASYWSYQSCNNWGMPAASNAVSSGTHKNFFQYLASLIGMGNPNGNKSSQEYSPTSGDTSPGTLLGQSTLNMKSSLGTMSSTGQGINSAQQGNNTANDAGTNSSNNSGNNNGSNAGNTSENDSENITGFNSEINAENTSESDNLNNSEDNSQTNSENNSGNNPGTNPGNNPGENPGNNPGDNSGGSSPNNSGSTPSDNNGDSTGYVNQNTLPTINPIPSDNSVSQSIAQQNIQNDALAAALAAHQALVIPVQQQAQATKFQTVNSGNIPPPSTNTAPSDVVTKIRSNQLAVTH